MTTVRLAMHQSVLIPSQRGKSFKVIEWAMSFDAWLGLNPLSTGQILQRRVVDLPTRLAGLVLIPSQRGKSFKDARLSFPSLFATVLIPSQRGKSFKGENPN